VAKVPERRTHTTGEDEVRYRNNVTGCLLVVYASAILLYLDLAYSLAMHQSHA
jgi:hypothetical protein